MGYSGNEMLTRVWWGFIPEAGQVVKWMDNEATYHLTVYMYGATGRQCDGAYFILESVLL